MHKAIINGERITIQDRKDWKTNIDEDFKPGDYFCAEIAWDLINAVPPHRFTSGYFQCGEAHSHRPDHTGLTFPTYLTLEKVSGNPDVWKFCGYCFDGENTETWRKYYK